MRSAICSGTRRGRQRWLVFWGARVYRLTHPPVHACISPTAEALAEHSPRRLGSGYSWRNPFLRRPPSSLAVPGEAYAKNETHPTPRIKLTLFGFEVCRHAKQFLPVIHLIWQDGSNKGSHYVCSSTPANVLGRDCGVRAEFPTTRWRTHQKCNSGLSARAKVAPSLTFETDARLTT
jgi:hypothetical protein